MNYIHPAIHYKPEPRFTLMGWYIVGCYEREYLPGYYTTPTKYFRECNLYDAATGNLVYSAITSSFNSLSLNQLGNETGQMVIMELIQRDALIDQKREN